jgi:hypothetical protein
MKMDEVENRLEVLTRATARDGRNTRRISCTL